VTAGSRRLLSIQLPIAYLNGISQNPHWLLIFTARKTQGRRASKGTEKNQVETKSQDPVISAPQRFLLKPEEVSATRTVSD